MSIYKKNDSKNFWTKFSHRGVQVHRSTGCTDMKAAKLFEKAMRAEIDRKLQAQATPSLASGRPGERRHIITKSEEEHYLLVAPQPLHDIAVIMLETGMRPQEIWGNIHTEQS